MRVDVSLQRGKVKRLASVCISNIDTEGVRPDSVDYLNISTGHDLDVAFERIGRERVRQRSHFEHLLAALFERVRRRRNEAISTFP